jgi:energy-coupling factor transporter ATP-binding protein EcfA2
VASLQQIAARAGFVRPRFDDGTFEDALPLRDHFEERFLDPAAPVEQLALIGPRGSGLTTTLAWLHGLTEPCEHRESLTLKSLLSDAERSLELLASGRGVLFLDTSVTPIAPRAWRTIRRLFSKGVSGHPGSLEILRSARLVVTRPKASSETRPQGEWPSGLSRPQRAYLCPWTDDDLLELLGSRPDYRDRRSQLFKALGELPSARSLLARPRTARWLVEAALRLEPDQELSLGRLYGEVLSQIAPSTRELLSTLRSQILGPRELQRLLTEPPRHLDELVSIFELPRALANVLHDPAHDLVERAVHLGFLSADTLQLAREQQQITPHRSLVAALLDLGALSPGKLLALSGQVQPDFGQGTRVSAQVPLALPGLQHCLAARECLDGVRSGQPPARVDPECFPFLREEIDAGIRRRLITWIREPEAGAVNTEEDALPRDSVAATLLWVSGLTPPFDGRQRPLDLTGASLAGLNCPGAALAGSDLCRADLGQARLEGADLSRARIVRTGAMNAVLDGADLSQATLWQARLER